MEGVRRWRWLMIALAGLLAGVPATNAQSSPRMMLGPPVASNEPAIVDPTLPINLPTALKLVNTRAMDVAIAAGLPLFPKDDSVALGRLLVRLVSDRPYLREIAARGQLVAQREFNADLMVDRLESMLLRIASSGETRGSAKQSG